MRGLHHVSPNTCGSVGFHFFQSPIKFETNCTDVFKQFPIASVKMSTVSVSVWNVKIFGSVRFFSPCERTPLVYRPADDQYVAYICPFSLPSPHPLPSSTLPMLRISILSIDDSAQNKVNKLRRFRLLWTSCYLNVKRIQFHDWKNVRWLMVVFGMINAF